MGILYTIMALHFTGLILTASEGFGFDIPEYVKALESGDWAFYRETLKKIFRAVLEPTYRQELTKVLQRT